MKPCPPKPTTLHEQIEMMWYACFNHLPHKIDTLNWKLNFLLSGVGVVIALLGLIIAVSR